MSVLRYLRAILRHTAALLTGGAIAFFIGVFEHLRGLTIPSGYYLAIVGCGVLWASYKAWFDEHAEVVRLNALATQRPRAELVIYPERRCRFYIEVDGQRRDTIRGVYLQLDLSVENKGDQVANIRNFRVFVREFGKTWNGLTPEQRDAIQTKASLHGLSIEWMNTGDALLVPAHSVKKGILAFYLDITAPPRGLNKISVTLTLIDTDGVTEEKTFDVLAIEEDKVEPASPASRLTSESGDPQGWMA